MLLYEKYLYRIFFVLWSGLLLFAFFDLYSLQTSPSTKQSFLIKVIITRVLVFYQAVSWISRITQSKKSLLSHFLAFVYIALKLLLVMVYFEDNTDPQTAIPFLIFFSSKGLLTHLLQYNFINNMIIRKLFNTIRMIVLNPFTLYHGYKVMNNYIKRYAQDISYEEINVIRVQQLLAFAWIPYFVYKGLKYMFNSKTVPSQRNPLIKNE